MAIQIQLRRGTAAQWTSSNPTLAAGEIGVETDTGKIKAGDGTTAWNSLGYVIPSLDVADLGDVTITDAASGEALAWNGSAWVNTDLTSTITAAIVDSAPATLDTLNEIAAALGDDADFANTIANTIATKADASHTHSLVDVTDVTATAAELNTLDGITASTAELNILDGVTATTAELNYTDGVTSNIQTQLDAKSPVVSAISSTASNIAIDNTYLNKTVLQTSASDRTFTLNSGISIGGRIDFINMGTAILTFAAGGGVTLVSADGALILDTQYKAATVFVTASNTYVLVGALS